MKLPGKIPVKNTLLHPTFLLFVFNLIFFIKPVLLSLYISPTDSLQRFPSFNIGEFYAPKNSLLFDPVTQFQPWFKFAKESVSKGELPVWNSLNAGGVPFLANSISSLLFPLTLVYYIFDFQKALITFHFLKLFLIGLFTYLFLRELKISKYASLVGATAFNFAGFNIVWLLWPQTNVIVFLPLLLYLTEKLLNNSWSDRKSFILLSFATAFAVFAGHPETLFHIFLVVIAYFLFRYYGVPSVSNLDHTRSGLKLFVSSIAVGLLLSGILLIPFIEYLLNSFALYDRVASQQGLLLPIYVFVYNIFPNLSGNPSTPYYRALNNSNYNELVGGYVGPIILFLSIFYTLFYGHKDRKSLFFAILSFAVIPLIYKLPLFSSFSEILARIIGNTRLLFVFAFTQSVLAAKFLDEIPKVKSLKKIFLFSAAIIVSVSVVAFLGIYIFGPKLLSSFSPQKISDFIIYEKKQILFFAITFVFGIYLVYFYSINKKMSLPLIFLAILIFLQTGILNINYNPAIEEKYFYPDNEDIKVLKSLPKGKYMELGGDHVIPADINLWYGLESVHNYDALDIYEYKKYFNASFPEKTNWNTILNANSEFLNLFGVRYIVSYTDIDKKIEFNNTNPEKHFGELDSETIIEQEFKASSDNLTAIRLLTANFNRLNTCEFEFQLTDVKTKKHVIEDRYPCDDVSDKIFYQINFPPIENSFNRVFGITLRVIDGVSGNMISFWHNPENSLVFNTIYDEIQNPNLKLIHEGKFKIYENLGVFPEYYLTSGGKAIIQKSESSYKRILTNTNEKTLLTSTNSYYPGWKVYIDSKKGKIENVNQAFQGVMIPEGKHLIEFIYQPESYYLGALMSVTGCILLYVSYNGKKKLPKS